MDEVERLGQLHSLDALPLEACAVACDVVPLPAEEAVVAVAHGRNAHVPEHEVGII